MLTYGPDLSFSLKDLSTEEIIDLGKKLTYYSPFIVPFSYSSPFYGGNLWHGLSVRTYVRTGPRPAVMVFIDEPEKLIHSNPSLTKKARIPAEVGRIEFKAFDSCADFALYSALFALLKGLAIDQTLTGRAVVPDGALHQLSAQEGFANDHIFSGATEVLHAVRIVLAGDADGELLAPIEDLLAQRKTPAHRLIEEFNDLRSIDEVLRRTYTDYIPQSDYFGKQVQYVRPAEV
jgi:hypothetical protein